MYMCKLGLCKCDQAKTRPARLLATAMMTGMDMVGQSIGQSDHVYLYTMLVWEGEAGGGEYLLLGNACYLWRQ